MLNLQLNPRQAASVYLAGYRIFVLSNRACCQRDLKLNLSTTISGLPLVLTGGPHVP